MPVWPYFTTVYDSVSTFFQILTCNKCWGSQRWYTTSYYRTCWSLEVGEPTLKNDPSKKRTPQFHIWTIISCNIQVDFWICLICICDLIFRISSLEEIQVAKTEAQKLQASRTIAQTRVLIVWLQMLACSQAESFQFARIRLLQWIHVHCIVNSKCFSGMCSPVATLCSRRFRINWIGIIHLHLGSILIVQVLLDAQKAELPRAEREAKETSQSLSPVHHITAFLSRIQDVWML